jgi:hypothetical protein
VIIELAIDRMVLAVLVVSTVLVADATASSDVATATSQDKKFIVTLGIQRLEKPELHLQLVTPAARALR